MRKFNKESYHANDMRTKLALKTIIEATNKYVCVDGLDSELYKECDLKFKHVDTDRIVRFENEVRNNFDTIVNSYLTIHIPIRKKNTPSDFYLVWNSDLTQLIMIPNDVIKKHIHNIVTVKCEEDNKLSPEYVEDFLDVPKKECTWYVVGQNNKLIKLDW